MAQKSVQYNGKTYTFPEDATSDEILAFLESQGEPAGGTPSPDLLPPEVPTETPEVPVAAQATPQPIGPKAAQVAGVIAKGVPVARAAAAGLGTFTANAAQAPAIVGATIGATTGGSLGSAFGGPLVGGLGGGTLGAVAGRKIGNTLERPIRQAGVAVERTFSPKQPRVTMRDVDIAEEEARRLRKIFEKFSERAPRANITRAAEDAMVKAEAAIPKYGNFVKGSSLRKLVGKAVPAISRFGNVLGLLGANAEVQNRLNAPESLAQIEAAFRGPTAPASPRPFRGQNDQDLARQVAMRVRQ
uniref:Uncharacterized protein n=1 Tax=viral metagenome TaxID=1070528 RepID=A0A6M3LGC4_9ZZZZ